MKKRTVLVAPPVAMVLIVLAAPAQSQVPAGKALDVCALLSLAEASDLTGIAVERAEPSSSGCSWYPKPGAAQQKGADTTREAFEKMTKQDAASFEEGLPNIEKLMKGLTGAASGDGPLFKASVELESADQSEATFKATMGMMSGMAGGVPGSNLEQIPGVGDRAYMAPLASGLYVRKGRAWIELDLRGFSGEREQAIAIARRIVSRL
jgi:hypothetical protein